MGIYIDGGMIVGERADKVEVTDEMMKQYDLDDEYEFYTEVLDNMSPYYDSEPEDWIVGYEMPDVEVGGDNWTLWVNRVEEAAKNFERLTGVKAKLFGSQDVT